MDRVITDLKAHDLAVDLIGSRAVGLSAEDSDINVLVTLSMEVLKRAVEAQVPATFTVKRFPLKWNSHRALVLTHIHTNEEIVIISRCSADLFLRERDIIIQLLLDFDDRVGQLLRLIGQWYSRRRDELPPDAPNRYVFRLSGLHFLMSRIQGGPLLPPMTEAGPFLNKLHPTWKARSTKSAPVHADELFHEWLRKISKSDTAGLLVDLRHPYALEDIDDSEVKRWRILDVATQKDIVNFKLNSDFTARVPRAIAQVARRDVAQIANQQAA
jgi:hypothetical protein